MKIPGVVESLVEFIRDQIITGDLAAGQKLNEVQLATAYNISRPPLREAFRALENNRLVVSVPRKGCYVSKLSIEDLQKVFEARAMIEGYAIDLLQQRNVTAVPQMVFVYSKASELNPVTWDSMDKRERLQHLKMLADFHTKLVESAGNDLLVNFHQTITYSLARYQYKYPYQPERFQQSQEIHRQIMEEIQKGLFEQAKRTLLYHHRTFAESVERKMSEENISRE